MQNLKIDKINNILIMLAVVALAIMFLSQLVSLALVATKGAEVTSIRYEKSAIRVEVDSLRAEIDEAKTLAQINDGIDTVYAENSRRINPIEINLPSNNSNLGLSDGN